jgi:hypothetical protein
MHNEKTIEKRPSRFQKLSFWVLLGLLSTFFAEVLVPSSLFPFFLVKSLVLTVPLYTLHILVLSSLIWRFGKPLFPVLYSAGFIFGLYEAYYTKVLWVPNWPTTSWDTVGGVHMLVVLVVVGFWHAFLAFILPLIIADTYLTKGGELYKNLPVLFKKIISSPLGIGCLVILFGITSTFPMEVVLQVFSPLTSGLVLLFVLFLWRKNFGKYRMEDLLPRGLALYLFSLLLLLCYFIGFVFISRENMPTTLIPHLTIWLLYLVAGLVLVAGLYKKRDLKNADSHHFQIFPWQKVLIIFATFIFVGVISFIFLPLQYRVIILILSWVPFGIIALVSIIYSMVKTFAK